MNKKKFCKIFFPILGAAVLIGGIYWSVIKFVLKDYQNLGVIQFRYLTYGDENTEMNKTSPAYITGIKATDKKDYPDVFEVPSKLLGHPVVGIDANAFKNLSHLKKVILPKTVEEIGDYAFSECPQLEEVVVKGNLTSVGNEIFRNSKWETIQTSSDKEFITFEKFLYKYNGTIEGNTVLKSENDKGKNEDSSYNYVYIPGDIKELCSGSFTGQDGIVKVEIPSEYKTIEIGVFSYCTNLKDVVINNVTSIKTEAFMGCTLLENIDLSNVTSYGSDAFNGTNIKTVTLNSKVTSIADGLFANCENLSSITIPENVTSIGQYVFENDTSLESISLNDNITIIGNGAFKNTRIKNFKVPSKVNSLNAELFEDDIALESITLPEVVKDNTVENGYRGILSIGRRTFANTKALKSIDIPTLTEDSQVIETVKSMGESAFEGSGITKITIPSNMIQLENATFKNCENLNEVTFAGNGSLQTVYNECFKGTKSLKEIVFPNTISTFYNAVLQDSAVENVTLPNNSSFITLSTSFFDGCSGLKSVVIPESVNTIQSYAFRGCTSLTNITIGKNVQFVDNNIFENTSSSLIINIEDFEQTTKWWNEDWNVVSVDKSGNKTYLQDSQINHI